MPRLPTVVQCSSISSNTTTTTTATTTVLQQLLQYYCVVDTVHCQRLSELNERYNSCRAKTADTVAAAVKRKEDVSPSADVFFCYFQFSERFLLQTAFSNYK